MVPGHGPFLDFALESISYDEFIALAPLGDKAGYFRKVVTAIGIAHDDELAAGLFNSFAQRTAITLEPSVHHAGAVSLGDRDRVVGRTIVGHHHLARDPSRVKGCPGAIYASPNGLFLIKAGDDYGDFGLSLIIRFESSPWFTA